MDPTSDPEAGIRYEVRSGVGIITIDRPERGNSLTRAMAPRMVELWRQVQEDPEVRVVVVTGSGDRHFCTGIDVHEVAETGGGTAGDGPVETIAWSPLHHGVWKPVISALNGTVAGGGLHFVADADVVVAVEHASVLDTHVSVGMVGAVENVGLLHRLPLGAVLRMTFEGRHGRLSAARAHQLGLIDEVVPDDALGAALRIADLVQRNSPAALALSKKAIWGGVGVAREEAARAAWELAKSHRSHPDYREGPAAFAEGRDPRWSAG